uniref:hypothetical protein n=1 Tax=Algoriphagus sp. TaxID=1872435 RepID=UPI00258AA63A|nr:hypothetical protein [Algoriphagus sp.]
MDIRNIASSFLLRLTKPEEANSFISSVACAEHLTDESREVRSIPSKIRGIFVYR